MLQKPSFNLTHLAYSVCRPSKGVLFVLHQDDVHLGHQVSQQDAQVSAAGAEVDQARAGAGARRVGESVAQNGEDGPR